MLEGIEALLALERCGTVSEAALSLRLTQSAVSKRIQSLQNELGFRLTEPEGRRVKLTPEARNFANRARPLLLELLGLTERSEEVGCSFSLALADSLASSWGPEVIRESLSHLPHLHLSLHAHRSALVFESVKLGRYQLGLCASPPKVGDLLSFPVLAEPMILLNAGLKESFRKNLPLITIESGSATWATIEAKALVHPLMAGKELIRVESFAACFQMVAAGFGNGLLPYGLVRSRKAKAGAFQLLKGISREIVLVARKSVSQRKFFPDLLHQLRESSRSFGSMR